MGKKDTKPPEGRKFYGAVTVSERGQIVVPAEARKDFNIKAGDKLLIMGDLEQGLWVATFPTIQKYLVNSANFANIVQSTMNDKPASEAER